MRTRVVIQSRLNSSRLPGKALLTPGRHAADRARGPTRLQHRARGRRGDERRAVRPAHRRAPRARGLDVVRGPLDDVLGRFVTAAEGLADSDRVVRLTGDNPVADGALVDELIAAVDRSTTRLRPGRHRPGARGLRCRGLHRRVLREAAERATAAYDREHVTPWIRRAGRAALRPRGGPTDRLRLPRAPSTASTTTTGSAGRSTVSRTRWPSRGGTSLLASVDRVRAGGPVPPRTPAAVAILLGVATTSACPRTGPLCATSSPRRSHGVSHACCSTSRREDLPRRHRARPRPAAAPGPGPRAPAPTSRSRRALDPRSSGCSPPGPQGRHRPARRRRGQPRGSRAREASGRRAGSVGVAGGPPAELPASRPGSRWSRSRGAVPAVATARWAASWPQVAAASWPTTPGRRGLTPSATWRARPCATRPPRRRDASPRLTAPDGPS